MKFAHSTTAALLIFLYPSVEASLFGYSYSVQVDKTEVRRGDRVSVNLMRTKDSNMKMPTATGLTYIEFQDGRKEYCDNEQENAQVINDRGRIVYKYECDLPEFAQKYRKIKICIKDGRGGSVKGCSNFIPVTDVPLDDGGINVAEADLQEYEIDRKSIFETIPSNFKSETVYKTKFRLDKEKPVGRVEIKLKSDSFVNNKIKVEHQKVKKEESDGKTFTVFFKTPKLPGKARTIQICAADRMPGFLFQGEKIFGCSSPIDINEPFKPNNPRSEYSPSAKDDDVKYFTEPEISDNDGESSSGNTENEEDLFARFLETVRNPPPKPNLNSRGKPSEMDSDSESERSFHSAQSKFAK